MKKLIIAVMSLLLVCSIAFANGAEESTSLGPVTVTFWNSFTGSDRPYLEQIVSEFNESQDEVFVDMLIMPQDTLYQRLMTSFIAGDAPDLIAIGIDRLAEYASTDRLLDLGSYIESSDVISADIMAPAVYNAGNYKGIQYAVPMTANSVAMYYNKDHFRAAGLDPDNPPQTLGELKKRWIEESLRYCLDCRYPLIGYTYFPLIDMVDWEWRLDKGGDLSPYIARFGLFDGERRERPAAQTYRAFAEGGAFR